MPPRVISDEELDAIPTVGEPQLRVISDEELDAIPTVGEPQLRVISDEELDAPTRVISDEELDAIPDVGAAPTGAEVYVDLAQREVARKEMGTLERLGGKLAPLGVDRAQFRAAAAARFLQSTGNATPFDLERIAGGQHPEDTPGARTGFFKFIDYPDVATSPIVRPFIAAGAARADVGTLAHMGAERARGWVEGLQDSDDRKVLLLELVDALDETPGLLPRDKFSPLKPSGPSNTMTRIEAKLALKYYAPGGELDPYGYTNLPHPWQELNARGFPVEGALPSDPTDIVARWFAPGKSIADDENYMEKRREFQMTTGGFMGKAVPPVAAAGAGLFFPPAWPVAGLAGTGMSIKALMDTIEDKGIVPPELRAKVEAGDTRAGLQLLELAALVLPDFLTTRTPIGLATRGLRGVGIKTGGGILTRAGDTLRQFRTDEVLNGALVKARSLWNATARTAPDIEVPFVVDAEGVATRGGMPKEIAQNIAEQVRIHVDGAFVAAGKDVPKGKIVADIDLTGAITVEKSLDGSATPRLVVDGSKVKVTYETAPKMSVAEILGIPIKLSGEANFLRWTRTDDAGLYGKRAVAGRALTEGMRRVASIRIPIPGRKEPLYFAPMIEGTRRLLGRGPSVAVSTAPDGKRLRALRASDMVSDHEWVAMRQADRRAKHTASAFDHRVVDPAVWATFNGTASKAQRAQTQHFTEVLGNPDPNAGVAANLYDALHARADEIVEFMTPEQVRSIRGEAKADVEPPPGLGDAPPWAGEYQRIEEAGTKAGSVQKPHGLYTTPAGTVSPHADLGGVRTVQRANPAANVLEVGKAQTFRSNRGDVPESAGVAAARRLLGDERVADMMAARKDLLIDELSRAYPNVEWARYYDQQEMVEGVAGIEARRKGYDAIYQTDPDPKWVEFVGLNERAFAPAATAPAGKAKAPPKVDTSPMPKVKGGGHTIFQSKVNHALGAQDDKWVSELLFEQMLKQQLAPELKAFIDEANRRMLQLVAANAHARRAAKGVEAAATAPAAQPDAVAKLLSPKLTPPPKTLVDAATKEVRAATDDVRRALGPGEPVFRGTTAGRGEIKTRYRKDEQMGFGIHYTPDRGLAEKYATDPKLARRGKEPFVEEVRLDLKNPLDARRIVWEGDPEWPLVQRLTNKKKPGHPSDGRLGIYLGNAIDSTSPKRAEGILREAGYDGLIYDAVVKERAVGGYFADDPVKTYVAFDVSQIRRVPEEAQSRLVAAEARAARMKTLAKGDPTDSYFTRLAEEDRDWVRLVAEEGGGVRAEIDDLVTEALDPRSKAKRARVEDDFDPVPRSEAERAAVIAVLDEDIARHEARLAEFPESANVGKESFFEPIYEAQTNLSAWVSDIAEDIKWSMGPDHLGDPLMEGLLKLAARLYSSGDVYAAVRSGGREVSFASSNALAADSALLARAAAHSAVDPVAGARAKRGLKDLQDLMRKRFSTPESAADKLAPERDRVARRLLETSEAAAYAEDVGRHRSMLPQLGAGPAPVAYRDALDSVRGDVRDPAALDSVSPIARGARPPGGSLPPPPDVASLLRPKDRLAAGVQDELDYAANRLRVARDMLESLGAPASREAAAAIDTLVERANHGLREARNWAVDEAFDSAIRWLTLSEAKQAARALMRPADLAVYKALPDNVKDVVKGLREYYDAMYRRLRAEGLLVGKDGKGWSRAEFYERMSLEGYIQHSLTEAGAKKVQSLAANFRTDKFDALLERGIPGPAQAVNEQVRQRFARMIFHEEAGGVPVGPPNVRELDDIILGYELDKVMFFETDAYKLQLQYGKGASKAIAHKRFVNNMKALFPQEEARIHAANTQALRRSGTRFDDIENEWGGWRRLKNSAQLEVVIGDVIPPAIWQKWRPEFDALMRVTDPAEQAKVLEHLFSRMGIAPSSATASAVRQVIKEDLVLPAQIADFIEFINQPDMVREAARRFGYGAEMLVDVADESMALFKMGATVAAFAFHGRNHISNQIQGAMMIGPGFLSPRRQFIGASVVGAKDGNAPVTLKIKGQEVTQTVDSLLDEMGDVGGLQFKSGVTDVDVGPKGLQVRVGRGLAWTGGTGMAGFSYGLTQGDTLEERMTNAVQYGFGAGVSAGFGFGIHEMFFRNARRAIDLAATGKLDSTRREVLMGTLANRREVLHHGYVALMEDIWDQAGKIEPALKAAAGGSFLGGTAAVGAGVGILEAGAYAGVSALSSFIARYLGEGGMLIGAGLGQAVESQARATAYITLKEQGLSPSAIGLRVKEAFFDYDDLTPFFRYVIRRVVPFATWEGNNVALQAKALSEHPHFYQFMDRVLMASQKIDLTEEDIAWLPDYEKYRWVMNVNLGRLWGMKDSGTTTTISGVGTPIEALVETLRGKGLSRTRPGVKMGYSVLTGKDPFFNVQITDIESATTVRHLPAFIQHALGYSGEATMDVDFEDGIPVASGRPRHSIGNYPDGKDMQRAAFRMALLKSFSLWRIASEAYKASGPTFSSSTVAMAGTEEPPAWQRGLALMSGLRFKNYDWGRLESAAWRRLARTLGDELERQGETVEISTIRRGKSVGVAEYDAMYGPGAFMEAVRQQREEDDRLREAGVVVQDAVYQILNPPPER